MAELEPDLSVTEREGLRSGAQTLREVVNELALGGLVRTAEMPCGIEAKTCLRP